MSLTEIRLVDWYGNEVFTTDEAVETIEGDSFTITLKRLPATPSLKIYLTFAYHYPESNLAAYEESISVFNVIQ